MSKPTIPSGTRDLSPKEVFRRHYIFNTIKEVFEKYGYQPIETPTMENLTTLEGKYGDEGDRLLFRIINSGDPFQKIKSENGAEIISDFKFDLSHLTEKGLRYDLTVPFARYVVMHQHEIIFPFKRYQIQPVFRADRPQRGRYREFYQCDADVVGSNSLINEMELIRMYDEVFVKLGIPVIIKLNNRKVLEGMAASIEAADKFIDITIAIDKLDKVGLQGVRQELTNKGLHESQLQLIEKFFSLRGGAADKLSAAKELLRNSPAGLKGITELENIYEYLALTGSTAATVEVDFTLARGLNYYTGAILEVKPTTVKMGSLGGGGRYDDLTGVFGWKGVSGVGISFGADRIFDVMQEMNLFPESLQEGTKILFVHFDEASLHYALPLVQQLRNEGIAAEIYPSSEKIKKQMKYADDKGIPYVVLIGENEMQTGQLTLKNMSNGEQENLTINGIMLRLK